MYTRAVELTRVEALDAFADPAAARSLVARALRLGANALVSPSPGGGELAAAARDADVALHSAGNRPTATLGWPSGSGAGAARALKRRHRWSPTSLRFVASSARDGAAAPVHPAATAIVRRTAGSPGAGFAAPWPTHERDPAWAPMCVLPESPLRRVGPGAGFAVNLWLCVADGVGTTQPASATVVARVQWADHAHSWRFEGPVRGAPAATIATLPLIRQPVEPLRLTLELRVETAGLETELRWVHQLDHDAQGLAFWSLAASEG